MIVEHRCFDQRQVTIHIATAQSRRIQFNHFHPFLPISSRHAFHCTFHCLLLSLESPCLQRHSGPWHRQQGDGPRTLCSTLGWRQGPTNVEGILSTKLRCENRRRKFEDSLGAHWSTNTAQQVLVPSIQSTLYSDAYCEFDIADLFRKMILSMYRYSDDFAVHFAILTTAMFLHHPSSPSFSHPGNYHRSWARYCHQRQIHGTFAIDGDAGQCWRGAGAGGYSRSQVQYEL